MISTLKGYLAALVAAVMSALAIAVTVLSKRNKTLKKQRDTARESADEAVEVIKNDQYVDVQVDEHLAEVARGEDDELVDPNSWE